MSTFSKKWQDMTDTEQNIFLWSISGSDPSLLNELSDKATKFDGIAPFYEFTMHINGVEVDAERVIKRMDDAFEWTVKQHVAEAVKEKFRELSEAFDPVKDVLLKAEKNLSESLGVQKDSWGDY